MSSIISGTSSGVLANFLQDYKSSLVTSGAGVGGISATNGDSGASNSSDAYILDLSQAAQDIINSQNSSSTPSTISLSETQKQKLQSILDKYKDAPVNSDTLSNLNSDLQQAGLSPDELAAIQQAKNYNPLQSLLNILFNSTDSSSASGTDSVLSGLGSPSSNSPLGDLQQQKADFASPNAPSLSNIF